MTGRYYISFYVPKPKGDIDTKEVIEQALSYIEKTQNQNTSDKHVISGKRFNHAWIRKTVNDESFVRSPSTPALVDFPEDISPSCVALEHVLDEKAFLGSWRDPAILLVLHDPTTRLAEVYQHCNHLQGKLEKFHSVFIVSNMAAGPHQMLYSKEPTWLGR